MGAWWANDAFFWWACFACVGAFVTALVALVIIAQVGKDERV